MTSTTPLVLLLPSNFMLLFFTIRGRAQTQSQAENWQADFLLSSTIIGACVVLISEVLSLFNAIDIIGVGVSWAVVAMAIVLVGRGKQILFREWRRFRRQIAGAWPANKWLLIITGVLLLILFLTGIVSPANNVDVMQYHMPRVLQWTQNKSLAHFPTAYDNQNTRPFFTELVVLNMGVLSGSDGLAGTVQLSALIGTMVAVAGIISLLGGNRIAQSAAALFAFSLPMGLLQVTTPKDDVMAGLWIAALLFFVIKSKVSNLLSLEFVGFGLSFGLGMLTKGTFLPFAVPIMIWYFVPQLNFSSIGKALRDGLLLLLIATAINGAFWMRNIKTYGGPYGDKLPLEIPVIGGVQSVNPGPDEILATSSGISSGSLLTAVELAGGKATGLEKMISLGPPAQGGIITTQLQKILQMAVMNLMTPVGAINEFVIAVLARFPKIFPEGYRDMLRGAVWSYANTAGNPLHFVLTSLLAVIAILNIRSREGKLLAQMSLVAIAGYGLISFSHCATWTVCMRYQLPFHIFGGVLLGTALSKLDWKFGFGLILLLVIYSIPYVLLNNMRPVIGMKPWPTRIGSVFTTPDDEILFAHIPRFRDEYVWIADQIKATECTEVGLYLKAYDFEYPIWWLLDAPYSGISLHHIHPSIETERYIGPDFAPCAVVCTICEGQKSLGNLSLKNDFGHVQYFSVVP